jgi:phosphatidylglycerophosphate synthase
LTPEESNRRPIAARSTQWAKRLSAFLAESAVTPNQISCFSITFAVFGGLALMGNTHWPGMIICALCIQGRLLCNLVDGMVALEGGKKSAVGALYNEFPDRIADSIFIIALGYATPLPIVGWLGALAASLTAYVRVFGGSLGLPQNFRGPMAKQHRMAVMTIACVAAAAEDAIRGTHFILLYAAAIIMLGSFVTCVIRTLAIARGLQEK